MNTAHPQPTHLTHPTRATPSSSLRNGPAAGDRASPTPAVRVTADARGDVLVERLQPNGHWRLRQYRKDVEGFITEVRPNGSCFPVGPGLRASLSPLQAEGPLLEAIRAELGRE